MADFVLLSALDPPPATIDHADLVPVVHGGAGYQGSISALFSGLMTWTTVPLAMVLTVPSGRRLAVHEELAVDGEVVVEGDLLLMD
ncbi:MAG: hypothetical protein GC191_08215 [Azospirillum sp.]|nr:hypothetical protein [Azospirillum sp.]